MTVEEIFAPYVKVAMKAARELDVLETKLNAGPEEWHRSVIRAQMYHLRHIIDRCFRQTCDFMPAHASKKAIAYCTQHGLGDIFTLRWTDQLKFERQSSRKTCRLIQEHKIPVSDLVRRVRNAKTKEDAQKIFELQEIVWILKEEDKELPRTNRPDSDKTYTEAGIEIVRNAGSIGRLFWK